jgi:hypothetical protein
MVSIFIASIDTSGSPFATFCPGLTATVTTVPGIGAPTWFGLPSSALRPCAPGSGHAGLGDARRARLAVQFEEHLDVPSSSAVSERPAGGRSASCRVDLDGDLLALAQAVEEGRRRQHLTSP